MMRNFFFILFLFLPFVTNAQFTMSGHVYDKSDGESLPGAAIFIPKTGSGAASNNFGFYSITVKDSLVRLRVSYLGYQEIDTTIKLSQNLILDFHLKEAVDQLQEIEVSATPLELQEQINSTRMGTITLQPSEISMIPTIGGETDLIKVAQLLPGVTSGSEGTTGMFVRGGTDDQNLVILDDAAVYNLSHLFGFFSVFNADAIKSVELVKGGFPAEYGGRLSSVMDVRMNEGSMQRYNARGGLGILTSRLTVDGPIVKDKMSFMAGARRTYIDHVFRLAGFRIPYYFYDYNVKLNYKISDHDRIYLSSYFGNDVLKLDEDSGAGDSSDDFNFGFRLGNFTSALRWNHIYGGQKTFANITIHQTRFKYDIGGAFIDNNLLIRSQIQDFGAKADWQYFKSPQNKFIFGTQATTHLFRPNVIGTTGEISELLKSRQGDLIQNIEGAFYAGNERELSQQLSVNIGMRYTYTYTKGRLYNGPEPRLAARYKLNPKNAFKASYSLMRQYMHRVSSSSLALPTDLWYPVTKNVQPQNSHQFSVGYTRIFPEDQISLSLEAYYKTMSKLIEYREGASLILNDRFESELLSGTGNSYGFEVLARKKNGIVKGWISYSLSKTTRSFDELNFGKRYHAKYDRRHVINLVTMTKLNERVSFSAVWAYQSGAWFTPLIGQFMMPNSSLTNVDIVPIYGERNGSPLSASHRLDINFILKPRGERRFGGEWHIGAYNFYNRAAPFRVDVDYNGVAYEYAQQGLFGFIPSVAYNFNFSSK